MNQRVIAVEPGSIDARAVPERSQSQSLNRLNDFVSFARPRRTPKHKVHRSNTLLALQFQMRVLLERLRVTTHHIVMIMPQILHGITIVNCIFHNLQRVLFLLAGSLLVGDLVDMLAERPRTSLARVRLRAVVNGLLMTAHAFFEMHISINAFSNELRGHTTLVAL